ncbi:MAG: lipid-A-disaccharide synthase [Duncaniella sp.]|uniref:lipid-A-disaccharide synthase n=1 Tax=Duncaniella sp. TaxID=2518496 RepID=UPI0023CC6671|nr:lipid-A-disaccharide synthase [Duncaniella sp.]MDE5988188.1 lipid-A-disaccharide synthase [Duncaniella sp.]
MKYFFSAGEASGDVHAAQVIKELLKLDASAEITYLGGDRMAAAVGHEPLIHISRMAFMGFIDVATHLPEVLGNMRTAKEAIRTMRPDAVVLVDYPGFNLKLAKFAKSLGIKVYYYIAPKLWAWKEYRMKQLKRYVDCIFSILPFEPDWFGERGVKVDYVGNPSVEEVEEVLDSLPPREEFLKRHGLSDEPILALVPGSRVGEIKANLPVMDAVARRHPEMQTVVAAAPSIDRKLYADYTSFPLVNAATLELMARSRAAMVTSGTASLECALAGCPQVVCYRAVGWKWAHDIFVHILKIPYAALPNLIGGKIDRQTRREVNREAARSGVRGCVVPEMLVHNCTSQAVDRELSQVIPDGPARKAQLEGYAKIRSILHTDSSAAANVAAAICRQLSGSHS